VFSVHELESRAVSAVAAAFVAAASLSAPLAVGPAVRVPSENPVAIVVEPDPRAGAWLHFPTPGGERLLRMGEVGAVKDVGLPRKLRGEELAITPLRDGWTVATDRYWPGGRAQEEECHPSYAHSDSFVRNGPRARSASSGCGEMVVAELSPRGRWTRVETLANTDGREPWVGEPVDVHGKVELAWAETGGEVGALLGIRVAAAAPGRPFGSGHALPRAAEEGENATISNLHGKFYLRAEYGKRNGYQPKYVGERRIYSNVVQYTPRSPQWVSAINNSGDALIPVMGPPNQLQLHFAAPR
jgi:hypothetical protein